MFKTAFLGCGGRARGHAAAYRHVTRGAPVACCDLNEGRLNAFGDAFGLAARYTSFADMVKAERPDVVHMVTLPGVRVELLNQAVELRVPAVIVEKPLACDIDEMAAIEALDGRGTKICVNHQLRFHKPFAELLQGVRDGRIGPLRLIDGSCLSRLYEQGSHVMNLIFALNGHEPPVMVHGGCGGKSGIQTGHPCADNAWAQITFANGVRASILCNAGAPRNGDHASQWMHKRVAAYGDAGHVAWWMDHSTRQYYGEPPREERYDYAAEDNPAQARLTEAMFDWLEDEGKPHPTRLEASLLEARTLMGIYASELQQAPVNMPIKSTEPFLPRLWEWLR
ncbi:MAG: Gfo/Idh/MocA family oxidoreductase [Armatimonadetes bacterium]|nr:Gfo/Idh/MocA family oxidoreductase [Armatimonadota bacterium]